MKHRFDSLLSPSRLAFAAIVVGLVLRTRQFLSGRSLWMDEAMLALNVVTRDFTGLLQPLDYNQGAPIGFLVLQKTANLFFGDTDFAMRLVPFVASVVAVVAFARLATAWLGVPGVLAALAMAFSPRLVEYSSEAKQYPVDVAVTVLVLGALTPWAALRDRSAKDWGMLAVAGSLAPWFSHPAAFLLPGAGLVVLWRAVADHRGEALRVLAVAIAWVASFGLLYFVSLRPLSSNAVLLAYWKTSFAPLGTPGFGSWTRAMVEACLRDATGIASGASVIVVAGGFLSLQLRRTELALVLALPLVLAFAASALQHYPFSGRMLLFAVPTVLLLAAEAAGAASRLTGLAASRFVSIRGAGAMVSSAVLAVVGVAFLQGPVSAALELARRPRSPEAVRPVLEYMLARREPGEAIYVYYGAKPAVNFYARTLPVPAEALVPGRAHRGDAEAYRGEVRTLLSSPGAWVVLSHNCPGCTFNEWEVILDELDAHGRRVDSYETAGAAVHHYRLDPEP